MNISKQCRGVFTETIFDKSHWMEGWKMKIFCTYINLYKCFIFWPIRVNSYSDLEGVSGDQFILHRKTIDGCFYEKRALPIIADRNIVHQGNVENSRIKGKSN